MFFLHHISLGGFILDIYGEKKMEQKSSVSGCNRSVSKKEEEGRKTQFILFRESFYHFLIGLLIGGLTMVASAAVQISLWRAK